MSDQQERRTDVKTLNCATPGCRNTQRFGTLCATCAKAARPKRTPQDIRTTVYPTGETRWAEGQRQTEMTDGRQTWWVGAMEEAA